MSNGDHDSDEVNDESLKTGHLGRLFPIGELEKSLQAHGYSDVQLDRDPQEADCFEVRMRSGDQAINPASVRQQLREIVGQLPEALPSQLRWRVVWVVAVIMDQQIAAAIKVCPVQMAH